MIHPIVRSDQVPDSLKCDGNYRIVALDPKLPAFDPLRMVKTALLSPIAVKRYNRIVIKYGYPIQLSVVVAFALRLVVLLLQSRLGVFWLRSLLPCMVVFVGGMRVEYKEGPGPQIRLLFHSTCQHALGHHPQCCSHGSSSDDGACLLVIFHQLAVPRSESSALNFHDVSGAG